MNDERDADQPGGPIRTPAARVALVLLVVAGLLIALSLATRYGAYRAEVAQPGSTRVAAWKAVMRLFDVNSEGNVPSWFSSMLLMGCALVAALLAALVRRAGGRDARYWAGLAAILSLLSLDEAVALHERLGGPAGEVLGDATRGPLHFAWIVPGAVLALVVGSPSCASWFASHPAPGGWSWPPPYCVSDRRRCLGGGRMVLESQGDRGGYLLVTAAEEGLEMAGSVLLLYAGMRLPGLRPEPDGGYHLSIGDLMPSQAAEHAGLAGCRLPSAPFSTR